VELIARAIVALIGGSQQSGRAVIHGFSGMHLPAALNRP